jgi:hypothetical protein
MLRRVEHSRYRRREVLANLRLIRVRRVRRNPHRVAHRVSPSSSSPSSNSRRRAFVILSRIDGSDCAARSQTRNDRTSRRSRARRFASLAGQIDDADEPASFSGRFRSSASSASSRGVAIWEEAPLGTRVTRTKLGQTGIHKDPLLKVIIL